MWLWAGPPCSAQSLFGSALSVGRQRQTASVHPLRLKTAAESAFFVSDPKCWQVASSPPHTNQSTTGPQPSCSPRTWKPALWTLQLDPKCRLPSNPSSSPASASWAGQQSCWGWERPLPPHFLSGGEFEEASLERSFRAARPFPSLCNSLHSAVESPMSVTCGPWPLC